jgi:hypothetical protein
VLNFFEKLFSNSFTTELVPEISFLRRYFNTVNIFKNEIFG